MRAEEKSVAASLYIKPVYRLPCITSSLERPTLPRGKRLASIYHGMELHYTQISNHFIGMPAMLWEGTACLYEYITHGNWLGNLAELTVRRTLHTSCDLAHIFVLKPWVTSPVDIADLTPFLLSCLEPFDTSSMAEPPQNHTFSENLSNLPRQIFQEVFGNLYPSNNLTTQCNRLMAPLLWRETLSTKSLIPWLWDIDEEACRQKDTQTPDDPSEHWDWELLVRTLTQERVFEPDHPLQHAPHGLRNRRRIWGIVEEIMQTSEEEKYFSRFARVR